MNLSIGNIFRITLLKITGKIKTAKSQEKSGRWGEKP